MAQQRPSPCRRGGQCSARGARRGASARWVMGGHLTLDNKGPREYTRRQAQHPSPAPATPAFAPRRELVLAGSNPAAASASACPHHYQCPSGHRRQPCARVPPPAPPHPRAVAWFQVLHLLPFYFGLKSDNLAHPPRTLTSLISKHSTYRSSSRSSATASRISKPVQQGSRSAGSQRAAGCARAGMGRRACLHAMLRVARVCARTARNPASEGGAAGVAARC